MIFATFLHGVKQLREPGFRNTLIIKGDQCYPVGYVSPNYFPKAANLAGIFIGLFFLSSAPQAHAKGDYSVCIRCPDVVSSSIRWGHSIPGLTYSPLRSLERLSLAPTSEWPPQASPVENLIDTSAWLRRMEWLFYPQPSQEWRPLDKRSNTQWPTLLGALASALIAASVMGVPFVLLHAKQEMDKDFPV